MLIVFLNYIVFLSAKIAIKTETFLIKILCFTIYHFIEWLMPGDCFVLPAFQIIFNIFHSVFGENWIFDPVTFLNSIVFQ